MCNVFQQVPRPGGRRYVIHYGVHLVPGLGRGNLGLLRLLMMTFCWKEWVKTMPLWYLITFFSSRDYPWLILSCKLEMTHICHDIVSFCSTWGGSSSAAQYVRFLKAFSADWYLCLFLWAVTVLKGFFAYLEGLSQQHCCYSSTVLFYFTFFFFFFFILKSVSMFDTQVWLTHLHKISSYLNCSSRTLAQDFDEVHDFCWHVRDLQDVLVWIALAAVKSFHKPR